jgi:hypothetical protein
MVFFFGAPALAEPPAQRAAKAPAASGGGQSALAEAMFQEALRLAKAGDLAAACPKFAASQRAVPSYGAAFNLGACHAELGHTASAWAAFSEAEPLARDDAERSEAKERIAALTAKLVRVRFSVSATAEGLTLTWDGAPLDRAAWDTAVPVDPGSHRVEAAAPGRLPWSSSVSTGKEGETLTVTIPALAVDEGAGASPRWPVQRTLGVVVGAAGLAGLAAGGVLGALASSKWDEAKRLCHPDDTCAPPGAATGNAARTLAHGSTAGFIAGGALAVAGVVLFVTAKSPAAEGKPPSAIVSPWISPQGGGASVIVSF